MDDMLENLQMRIKGSKIYPCFSGERLYIPYGQSYLYPVIVRVFFQVVDARLQLFVHLSSDIYSDEWCRQESCRLKEIIGRQFYEIIYNCEQEYKDVPLDIRLKDNICPDFSGIQPEEKKALRFLCQRKVAALVSESRIQRWGVAIHLARSRYQANRIRRLFIFLPNTDLECFKKKFFQIWEYNTFPVLFVGIESFSHNCRLYDNLLSYTDSGTMIIIDSCHLFKSPLSIRSKRIVDIAAQCNYKLVMTDSLIVNNIHDVYVPYNILSKFILNYYQWEDFSRMHIIYGGLDGTRILGYKNIAYLVDKVKPYTYAMSMAPSKETHVRIDTYCCELTPKQKYFYSLKKMELLSLIEKNDLSLYDIFRIFVQLQKIVCGASQGKNNPLKFDKTNKVCLLTEHLDKTPASVVIFCKYLFEIDLLLFILGKDNCTVICCRKSGYKQKNTRSGYDKKKYLISTLYFPESKLSNIEGFGTIVFFSLSFRYADYQRCFTYLKDCGLTGRVSIKRFVTNSGIDRMIIRNLKEKNSLAQELRELLVNKSRLIEFVKYL